MRILRGTLLAILLLASLCAVAAGEAGATIIIPEDTELPEDIRNPADPVELGSWGIPFTYPGDNNWYIYAHTETAELLGLALHEPPDPEAEAVEKSARNIPGVKAITALGLNVHDILNHGKLFVTKDAVARIEEVFA